MITETQRKFIISGVTKVKYISGKWGNTEANPLWSSFRGKQIGVIIAKDTRNCYTFDVRVRWLYSNIERLYNYEDLDLIDASGTQLKLF